MGGPLEKCCEQPSLDNLGSNPNSSLFVYDFVHGSKGQLWTDISSNLSFPTY